MIGYLLVFIPLVFMSFCDIFRQNRYDKLIIISIFYLFFVTLASFRAHDQDYIAYCELFNAVTSADLSNTQSQTPLYYVEPGFQVLMKFLSWFSHSSIIMFFFVSALAVFLNFYNFKRYSPFLILSIIWYFSHTFVLREMLQIRAGLACALCFFSIRYIIDRKLIPFIAIVCVAATIHFAAIIFIFVYFFVILNLNRKLLLFLLFTSIILSSFFPLGKFVTLIPHEKLLLYANSSEYNASIGVFHNPTVLKTLFFIMFGLLFYNKMIAKYKYFKIMFDIYLLSGIWLLLFNDFGIIAGRIATFFSITETILVPSYLLLLKPSYLIVFGWLIVVVASALILYLNVLIGNILPYYTIF